MIRHSLGTLSASWRHWGPHERRLLHVTRFIDRHGRERVYVRNPNTKRKKSIALTGATGTPEFMQQYHQAIKTLGLSLTPLNHAAGA